MNTNLHILKTAFSRSVVATPLCEILFLFCILFIPVQFTFSQTIADPAAPVGFRPTVTTSPNGIPMVHITAPSAGGVSQNKFSEYNVDAIGLILNNSTTGGISVLDGGAVVANPNFAGTAASVILNQVTGTNPSNLLGPTEIFGTKAKLILANPNGITVNGASFINTGRLTLTTATPTVAGANITFNVGNTSGITVGTSGFTGSGDVLDLLSRTVTLNGPVSNATTLDIRAGLQDYDYVTSVSSNTGGAAPGGTTYAIDAVALGAANAGQIKLIATDVGVGVRTASTMSATAGNFTISANGDVIIGGTTSTTGALSATSTAGSVKTSANFTSTGNTTITANAGTYTHEGNNSTIGGNLQVNAQNLTLAAGSKLTTTGTTTLAATQAAAVNGTVIGNNTVAISGDTVTSASTASINAYGATGTLGITGTTSLNLAGILYSDKQMTLTAPTITNASQAESTLGVQVNATTSLTNNSGGELKAGTTLDLQTPSLSNAGTLRGTSITGPGGGFTAFSNAGGTVQANSVNLTGSGTFNNAGGTVKSTVGGITLVFDTISNAGGVFNSAAALSLTADTGGFSNNGGLISSVGNMTLASIAGALSNNRGYILSFGDLTINLPNGAVDNTVGSIQASGNTTITATSLTNKRTAKSRTATNERSYYEQETSGEAMISSDGNLTINLTGALLNEASTIAAGNNLTITASSATNDSHFLETETWHQTRRRVGSLWWRRTITEWSYGGKSSTETPSYIYAGNNLTITIPGGFNNTGTIQANDFILNAGTINNGLQGRRTKAPAPTVPKNILTVSVSASLPDPANPLFHISSDPTTPYVIASVITPPSGFYTRDDIVALLGIAGQVNAKFFSDPLLEAKLIRQLVQLNTGKSFIYDDTKTDREQRQKLIDNMVTYLQTHPEITFGSIMSKEFVATLPAPMLWYELRTDAKTGITAYMPTLYLPNASLLDLKRFGGGQIIANNATLTAAGAMKNTGYVMVDQNLSITASEFINEKRTVTDYASYTQNGGMFGTSKTKTREFQVADFGGEIQAGDVTINTTGDITNRGGVIVADNDINLTSTQGSVKNEAIKSQFLVSWDRGNMGSLFGKKSSDLGTTFVSGQILAGDEINIDAAQNFENIASKVSAFGDINVIAEQNINQDLQTATYRTFDGGNFNINYDVSKIWFNPLGLGSSSASRTVVVTQRAETTSQTGSVNFTARNGDITSRGSTIGAGVDVNLEATKGNVLLDALTTYGKETSNQVQDTGVGKREINKAWNTATTELPVVTAGRDINITAGKNVTGNGVIASAGRDINVTAGNDINITSVKEYLHLDEHGQSLELSFVGSEIVKALYLGTDVGQAAIDSVSIAKQIQTLSKSRSAMDWMANGTQTASSTWDSAAGASAAYNNPNATASSKGLDAGQGGAYASAAVGGSVTQININYDRWVSLQSWTQSHLGEISAGNDINMTANRDINLKGGTQVVAQNNITLDAGRDITVEANKDVTESSYRSWGFTVGVDVQSLGVTVGGRQSWADSEGNTYTYGNVAAGNNLTVRSGNDLTLKGGTMSGDTVDIDVGGNLKIESLQNMYKSDSGNWSASVTVGFAGGGGSLSVGMASQDRLWADNMSGIEGKNGTNIRVENNTDLIGGYINDKSGNLTLDTGSLTWSDLKNHDKSESFSVSVSGSYSGGGDSSGSAGATGATSSAGSAGGSGEGSTSGSLAFSYSNKDKEGLTKSTIGQGTIIVRDKPDQDLAGLNRDLENAQTITKDDKTEVKFFAPIKSGEQWEKEAGEIATASKDVGLKVANAADRIGNALEALTSQVPAEYKDYGKVAQNYYKDLIEAGLSPSEASDYFNSSRGQKTLELSTALEKGVTAEGKTFADLSVEEANKALINFVEQRDYADLPISKGGIQIGNNGVSFNPDTTTLPEVVVTADGTSSGPKMILTTAWDEGRDAPTQQDVLVALSKILKPPAETINHLSETINPHVLNFGVQATTTLITGGPGKTLITKIITSFIKDEASNALSNGIIQAAGIDPNAPIGTKDFYYGNGIRLASDVIVQASTDALIGDSRNIVKGGQALGIVEKGKVPTIGGRQPINAQYAGKVHPSGVTFKETGFPDFEPFSVQKKEIKGLTGDYKIDSKKANSAAGLSETPKGYVWHHVEDGKTMLLVPQNVHQATRHTGGAAIIKNGGFDK